MLAAGWIELASGEDARQRLVQVTASRQALIERAQPLWRKAQDAIDASLGEASVERSARAARSRRDCDSTPEPRHEPAIAPHPATRYWPLVLAATAMLMITMGVRQSHGPVRRARSVAAPAWASPQISFALAIGQFVWGAVQPVFGAIADQHGPGRVLVAGGLLLAAGMALAPLLPSQWGLLLTLGC